MRCIGDEFEYLFHDLCKKALRERRIPFDLSLPDDNVDIESALDMADLYVTEHPGKYLNSKDVFGRLKEKYHD